MYNRDITKNGTQHNGENKMRFVTLILEVLDFIRETIEYKIQK